MNARRIAPLLALLGLAAALPAAAASPARLVAAQRALERAVYDAAPAALVQARGEFEALSRAEPRSAALHYWVAVADWRLVPRLTDPKQAERTCLDGLEHAEQALGLDPKLAEALAVKAGLQGLLLRFRPGEVMTLGAEIEGNLDLAIGAAPKNPRIRLIDGINTFHKPAFAGGGPRPALPKLRQAVELFASAAATDSTAARWGEEDALIWTGRSALATGDPAGARGFYARALELNPENGWVRSTLIPELERAEAAAAAADSSRSSAR